MISRLVVQREGIDYDTPTGRLQAQMLGCLAEFERELIRDRVRSGVAAARAKGVRLGRPGFVWRDEDLEELRALVESGESLHAIERGQLLRVFDSQGKARTPSAAVMSRALRAAEGT